MNNSIIPGWRKARPSEAPLIATQIYSPEFIVLLFTQATIALLADNHQLYNWEYLQTLGGAELDRFHDYAAIGTMFSAVLLPAIFLVVGYIVYRARAARPTFTAHITPWIVRNNLALAAVLSLASLGMYEYFPAQTTLFALLRLGIALAIVPFGLYSFYYLFAYQSHGQFRPTAALFKLLAIVFGVAVALPFALTELPTSADLTTQAWLATEAGLAVFFDVLRRHRVHVAALPLPQVAPRRRRRVGR